MPNIFNAVNRAFLRPVASLFLRFHSVMLSLVNRRAPVVSTPAKCAFNSVATAWLRACCSATALVATALVATPAFTAQSDAEWQLSNWQMEDEWLLEDDRPVVYLTFDDGPSADFVTEEVLQLLARHDATATFFITGDRVLRDGGKIAEIVYAGHAIGNHTHKHSKLTEISEAQVLKELTTASDVILAAGGPPQTCFRPPFGATNKRINQIAKQLGMVPVGWSIDTRDWETSTSIGEIAAALDRTTSDSVVLLHDGPSHRSKMLLALSAWMETSAHKYQFRALPECTPTGGILMAGVAPEPPVTRARPKPAEPQTQQQPETTIASGAGEPESTSATSEPVEQTAVVAPATPAAVADSTPPPAEELTIAQLLDKIRSYKLVLYDGDGQQVDLTQITANVAHEIHGEHIYFRF